MGSPPAGLVHAVRPWVIVGAGLATFLGRGLGLHSWAGGWATPSSVPAPVVALVRALPSTLPVLAITPNLTTALTNLEDALHIFSRTDSELLAPTLGENIAQWMDLSPLIGPSRWSELVSLKGLREIGIDLAAPAFISWGEAGGAQVLGFGLVDSQKFSNFLQQFTNPQHAQLSLGAEQALLIGADSDMPLTCVVRTSRSFCQYGSSPGSHPWALLRSVLSHADPNPRDPSSPMTELIARAHTRAPAEQTQAWLLVNPLAFGRLIGGQMLARSEHAHRFDLPQKRHTAQQNSLHRVRRLEHSAQQFEGILFALNSETGSTPLWTIRGEIVLAKHLRSTFGTPRIWDAASQKIRAWSQTPALARLFLHLKPEQIEWMAQALGWPFPSHTANGTAAWLLLGVDAECPLAHKGSAEAPASWAFVMPSALAMGIQSGKQDVLNQTLRTLIAHTGGMDGQVLDDMVVVGTGAGSGAAALRRLANLATSPSSEHPIPADPAVFLEGALQLQAIDAALAAGNFDADSRPELLMLALARRKLWPLLDRIGSITMEAHAVPNEPVVNLDIAFN